MSFTTQNFGIPPCIVSGCELDNTFAVLVPKSYFENYINFKLVKINTLAM